MKVRMLIPVWADPDLSGVFILGSERFIKIPAGSIGVIEGEERDDRGVVFAYVRHQNGLLSRLNPGTFEPVVDAE